MRAGGSGIFLVGTEVWIFWAGVAGLAAGAAFGGGLAARVAGPAFLAGFLAGVAAFLVPFAEVGADFAAADFFGLLAFGADFFAAIFRLPCDP
jgi:hypothetical protein